MDEDDVVTGNEAELLWAIETAQFYDIDEIGEMDDWDQFDFYWHHDDFKAWWRG
jgi:hypothetical protein